jgi:arsenate reductase
MESGNKLNILFLCTGNACRSQIAEGWANKLKSDCINAFSAGVRPAGKIIERAIKIMAEAGIDISRHHSKHLDELNGIDFDYVITLCDSAGESCPAYPKKTKVIHHPFADPSFLIGDEETIMKAFRKTRDEIRDFVALMPDNLK